MHGTDGPPADHQEHAYRQIAVGASHASWPAGGPGRRIRLPPLPVCQSRLSRAARTSWYCVDAVRTPAGKSAIARHRQPFRRAELAAVVLRGELHDGPGVIVADPRCAARYRVSSPGRAAQISERHGYPYFHSPARSHLCREVTSVFTEIIHRLMHRWQGKRAAGEREPADKAVISRCTLPRGRQEATFTRIAGSPGRSRPGVRSTRPGPYVGQNP
jgi:hypothetical protein